jgi:hypothetical protein
MNWISVKYKLPDCWSQHNKSFNSGYLLTYDAHGNFEINQYWKHYKDTANGLVLESEGWESEGVTHWQELKPPHEIDLLKHI